MKTATYYCQNSTCGKPHATKMTVEEVWGDATAPRCQHCGGTRWDDLPPDVTVPATNLGGEGTLDYFNRFQAGDR